MNTIVFKLIVFACDQKKSNKLFIVCSLWWVKMGIITNILRDLNDKIMSVKLLN